MSIDPREKPTLAAEKKANYLKRPPAGGGEGSGISWPASRPIERLADAVGWHYSFDPITEQFIHAAGIILLTPHGRMSQYFYGIEYSPNDLRLALVEASDNKIGTLSDKVLLYCYHYDPRTGKYGSAIMSMIRLLGVITLAALRTAFRREARPAAPAAGSKRTRDRKTCRPALCNST